MDSYSLCLAWNWEYDADFVEVLDHTCRSHDLPLLQVTPANLDACLQDLTGDRLRFSAFYDRASDTDAAFLPLGDWARRQGAFVINPHELARKCWDKSLMHNAITEAGRHTPTTIVLPPHEAEPELEPIDLSPLGNHFIIKPAHGGGGDGVVTSATCMEHVLEARRQYPSDKYLLQANVAPAHVDGRLAWFRVLYCTGKIYPFWWDTTTHIYVPVTPEEEARHGLRALRNIADATAHCCGLSLFSTEIAMTPEGRFVAVDYVNDPVDLRIQSKAKDGVPDPVVQEIASRLVELVSSRLSQ